MAYDLIFGKTKRNWAIGYQALPPMSDEVTVKLTEAEISMLAELAASKAQADAGDRQARGKMAKLSAKVSSLKKRAARGDESAKRTLLVLRESGIFNKSQSITMGNEAVSNQDYRVAVLRQARRVARGKRPTTLDFFKAKTAVDGTMRKAGIALFLPGSLPGRVTH
jgi:hypothetical protein